ncbi:MAG: hypothetical protein J6P72_09440 [Firmicutes bacterium]|nr:hypothetical protein [Bacillota bacterium]
MDKTEKQPEMALTKRRLFFICPSHGNVNPHFDADPHQNAQLTELM